jgi:hypothetical protein
MTNASRLLSVVLVCASANGLLSQSPTQVAEEVAIKRQEKTILLRKSLETAQRLEKEKDLPGAARVYEQAWTLVEELGTSAEAERKQATAGFSSFYLRLANDSIKAGEFKEADGRLSRLASWHILNYAFSGKTLFWQNIQPNENWFSVYRNDGKNTFIVGKGDDRPLTKYFLVDGKGSAAWEYSTKSWEYDKRETFISYQGSPALRVLQRDVPPRNTRLEDTDGTSVIVNVSMFVT